ncbi:MAG: RNA methyltransferase [Hyphomonadaceae bacterium]
MIVPVETASDPRLAPFTAVRERDLVRRDGRFLVEGKIALQALIERSRFAVEALFLSESRLKPLAHLLWRLDPSIPVYTAAQAVMDQTAGFHLHRGILGLARRETGGGVAAFLDGLGAKRESCTVLGLVGLSNHDNVGACFRNAAAFGADGVVLDGTCCDPLYRKSIRVSSGTVLSLPFAHGGAHEGAHGGAGEAMVDALEAHGFECWALTPTGGAPLQTLAPPRRLALLMGAEGPGLAPELMDRCRRVTIPMARGVDSLNVAAASAVALAHVHARRTSQAAESR